jgi:hypothetical protein
MTSDQVWTDARRLESWAGEFRLNLIRLAAIAGFYGYHLLDAYVLRPNDDTLRGNYHLQVTALALAWAVGALAIQLYLMRGWAPAVLKYVATGWDIAMITAVLMVGRDPHSMLTALYLLVIAAAALRLDLVLIYVAALGSMGGFLVFHGYIRYWLEVPPERRLSHAQQTLLLLALAVAGLIAGQVVRQARRLVEGHTATVSPREQ